MNADQTNLLADLRAAMEMLKGAPPPMRGIRAHHSVPYGRAFRQWDTNGQLWVWANRGEIEDLPRDKPNPSVLSSPLGYRLGVPIYLEGSA